MTADRDKTAAEVDPEPDDRERVRSLLTSSDWRLRLEEAARQRALVKAARESPGNAAEAGAPVDTRPGPGDRGDAAGKWPQTTADSACNALGAVRQMRKARALRDQTLDRRGQADTAAPELASDDIHLTRRDETRRAMPVPALSSPRGAARTEGLPGDTPPRPSLRTLGRFAAGVAAGFGACVLAVMGLIAWDQTPGGVTRAPPEVALTLTGMDGTWPLPESPRVPSARADAGGMPDVEAVTQAPPGLIAPPERLQPAPHHPLSRPASGIVDVAPVLVASSPAAALGDMPRQGPEVRLALTPQPPRMPEPTSASRGADQVPPVQADPNSPQIMSSPAGLASQADAVHSAVRQPAVTAEPRIHRTPRPAVLSPVTAPDSVSMPQPARPGAAGGDRTLVQTRVPAGIAAVRATAGPQVPAAVGVAPARLAGIGALPPMAGNGDPAFRAAPGSVAPPRVMGVLTAQAGPPGMITPMEVSLDAHVVDRRPRRVAAILSAAAGPLRPANPAWTAPAMSAPLRAVITVPRGVRIDGARLDRLGMDIAQVQVSPFAIAVTRVHFFHAGDDAQARRMAATLDGEAVDMTGVRPTPPRGHFDIQIAD